MGKQNRQNPCLNGAYSFIEKADLNQILSEIVLLRIKHKELGRHNRRHEGLEGRKKL